MPETVCGVCQQRPATITRGVAAGRCRRCAQYLWRKIRQAATHAADPNWPAPHDRHPYHLYERVTPQRANHAGAAAMHLPTNTTITLEQYRQLGEGDYRELIHDEYGDIDRRPEDDVDADQPTTDVR